MKHSSIIPTAEDGHVTPSSQCTVSFVPLFSASLPSLSLTGLLSEAGFDTFDKKVEYDEEEGMVWGVGTGVFNLPYSSGLPTDAITPSPDKYGVLMPLLASPISPFPPLPLKAPSYSFPN